MLACTHFCVALEGLEATGILRAMRASFFTARPFELFFGVGSPSILVAQGRLFVKMSKESVIDCGDRLQGGIIVCKPN